MNKLNEDELAANLEDVLDKVTNHTPVIIKRENGKSAVLISLEDFHTYQETLHLMASSENASRLNDAITEVEKNS